MKVTNSDIASAGRSRLGAINILLIDADRELSLVLKKVLRSLGFGTVHHAKDGSAALDILRKNPVDLVITDWDMQPMSGIQFINHVRNDLGSPNQTIPIIMLTGRAKRANVETARDTGITEFLVKPFTAKTLRDRIVLVIDHPRDFVVTPNYKGPDRRRKAVPVDDTRDRREHERNEAIALMGDDPMRQMAEKDVFVIDADFAIRKKIGEDATIDELLSEDNVREAQKIITQSREAFLDWIKTDLSALEEAYRNINRETQQPDDINAIVNVILKIKGRSGTFGYDLASEIADSLYEICFDVLIIDTNRLQVIRKHIDALYVIFRSNIMGGGGIMGRDLIESLHLLSKHYKIID